MRRQRSAIPDAIILLIWGIHIMVFVFFVPPWQHYDEPTHLEYALLIRKLGHVPAYDENIPAVRRAIAASMLAAGFFQHPQTMLTPPDLNDPNLVIGFNQSTHPPLYYRLVAAVLRPFHATPLATQLIAARLCSATIAVLLFYSVIHLLRQIGFTNQTRVAILMVLAFHPVLADTMSSVNSDCLANLVAVWIMMIGIGFVRHPHWKWFIAGVAIAVLAMHVKRVLIV